MHGGNHLSYATRAGYATIGGEAINAAYATIIESGFRVGHTRMAPRAGIVRTVPNANMAYLIDGTVDNTAYATTGASFTTGTRVQYASYAPTISGRVGYANQLGSGIFTDSVNIIGSAEIIGYATRSNYSTNYGTSSFAFRSQEVPISLSADYAEQAETCMTITGSRNSYVAYASIADKTDISVSHAYGNISGDVIGYATNCKEVAYASKAGQYLSNTGINFIETINYSDRASYSNIANHALAVTNATSVSNTIYTGRWSNYPAYDVNGNITGVQAIFFPFVGTNSVQIADQSNSGSIAGSANVASYANSGLRADYSSSAGYAQFASNIINTNRAGYANKTNSVASAGSSATLPIAISAKQANIVGYASSAGTLLNANTSLFSNASTYATNVGYLSVSNAGAYSTTSLSGLQSIRSNTALFAQAADYATNAQSADDADNSSFANRAGYVNVAQNITGSISLVTPSTNYAAVASNTTNIDFTNSAGYSISSAYSNIVGYSSTALNSQSAQKSSYANIAGAVINTNSFVGAVNYSSNAGYSTIAGRAGIANKAFKTTNRIAFATGAHSGDKVDSQWSTLGPIFPPKVQGTERFAKTIAICMRNPVWTPAKDRQPLNAQNYTGTYQVFVFSEGMLTNVYPPSFTPWYTGNIAQGRYLRDVYGGEYFSNIWYGNVCFYHGLTGKAIPFGLPKPTASGQGWQSIGEFYTSTGYYADGFNGSAIWPDQIAAYACTSLHFPSLMGRV